MTRLLLLLLLAGTGSAQWQTQAVATEADFRGLAVMNAKTAWVSGTQGTVGRTTDGTTWEVVRVPGAETLDFRDVEAFNSTTAVVLSIGPGDASRIYKTADGGKTWALQFKNENKAAFYDAIAFWDETHGLALGDPVNGSYQLLHTEDGRTWTPLVPKTMPKALATEGAFAASGTCLVTQGENDAWFVTGGGPKARVFHTTDRGRNWTVQETPLLGGADSAGAFSIAFKDGEHGIIVGGDYKKPKESDATAAMTSDGGKTWTAIEGKLPFRSCVAWAGDRWLAVGTSGSHTATDPLKDWKTLDVENYNVVRSADGATWAAGPKGRVAKMAK